MSVHFPEITDYISTHPQYAVGTVFLLAFAEAVPIVGTVVPGSTLIVAISALAIDTDINPWYLLDAAVIGAVLGDGASFWLGQTCHREILTRWPLNRFPRFIAKSEAFFNRFGGASVFLARFTAVVRAFVPLIAGILRMPARQFYVANILSALIWAPAHVFPGVVFGLLVRLAGASPELIFALAIIAMPVAITLVRVARYYFNRDLFGGAAGGKKSIEL